MYRPIRSFGRTIFPYRPIRSLRRTIFPYRPIRSLGRTYFLYRPIRSLGRTYFLYRPIRSLLRTYFLYRPIRSPRASLAEITKRSSHLHGHRPHELTSARSPSIKPTRHSNDLISHKRDGRNLKKKLPRAKVTLSCTQKVALRAKVVPRTHKSL